MNTELAVGPDGWEGAYEVLAANSMLGVKVVIFRDHNVHAVGVPEVRRFVATVFGFVLCEPVCNST